MRQSKWFKGELVDIPLPISLVSGGTGEAELPQLSIKKTELWVEGRYWATLFRLVSARPSRELSLHAQLETMRWCESGPFSTRRMSMRLRQGLTMYPTHLQQGKVSQNSTFPRVVSAKPSQKQNVHFQPGFHATTKQWNCLFKKKMK